MISILLRGPIMEPNSHGHTLRYLAIAMHQVGVNIRTINCSSGLWNNHSLKVRKQDATVLKEIAANHIDPNNYLLVQHIVPHQFIFDPKAKANIGYVSFETDRLPQQWIIPMQAMDRIWAPSFFNANIFKEHLRTPIAVVPHGIDTSVFCSEGPKIEYNLPDDVVKFGCCFDLTPRKNSLGAVESFFLATRDMPNKAVLIMKVFSANPNTINALKSAIVDMRKQLGLGKDPKVLLIKEIFPDYRMGEFYRAIDCLISISHGEGFCKPVLECMGCGVPSIVTGWSGHMDFCNSLNSFWIGDSPISGVPPTQIHHCGDIYEGHGWAYPALDHVADNIRFITENRDGELFQKMRTTCIATAKQFDWNLLACNVRDMLAKGYGLNE